MAKPTVDLKHSSDQILQGIRIVLPGTQALMGFQFIAFFNPTFHNLPSNLQNLHFIALILVVLCSILLISPVAFQQISENGRPTKRFLRFTRRMLTAAMLFLILAIACDIYLAARLIDMTNLLALGISLVVFLSGIFLWYVYSLLPGNLKNH